MPKCYCQSSGCAVAGGREVSKRVYGSHARNDRSSRVRNAQAASQNALQEQEEIITSHIAAMTLSDQVSGISPRPGGRLWSKSSSQENQTEESPSHFTFSVRELIEHNLKRLRDLEQSLCAVRSEANSKLTSIGSPLERTAPFPLKSFIIAAQDISDQLDLIKQRVPSVQESKAQIVCQTQELLESLRVSQRQWLDQAKSCPVEVIPDSPCEVNTG